MTNWQLQYVACTVWLRQVSGVAQWKSVGIWQANFSWPAPHLQLMG